MFEADRMHGWMQDKGLDVRNNKVIKLGELPSPGQATSAPQPRQQAVTPPDARRELATALNQKIHSAFSMARPAEAQSNRTAMQQGSVGLQQSLQQQAPPPQLQGLRSTPPAPSMQMSCQQGSMHTSASQAGISGYPATAATLPMCQTPQPYAASPKAAGAASRESGQISLSTPGRTPLAGTVQQHAAQSAMPLGQAEQQEVRVCPASTSTAIAQAQQPGSRFAGTTAERAIPAIVPVPKPLPHIQAVQSSAHAHAAPREPMLYTDSKSIPTPPQHLQPEVLLAPTSLRQSDTL